MNTELSRQLDELGKLVIPREMRKSLGIRCGDEIDIIMNENETITLKKSIPDCIICGSTENLNNIDNKSICKQCISKIINL